MEKRFDPMTGLPIEQPAAPAQRFDPMTGQPIAQPAEQAAPVEPVVPAQPVAPTPVAPVEPTPVAPVQATPVAPTQPVAPAPAQSFDPMTGQPIIQQAAPVAPKKKKKTGLIIGIIVAAVAVIAAGTIGVLAATGAFQSKEEKLFKAIVNTYEDGGELFKELDTSKILESGDFTIGLDMAYTEDYEKQKINLKLLSAKDAKEIVLDYETTGTWNSMSVSGTLLLDENAVTISTPLLEDTLLKYTYTEQPTGYIATLVDAETLDQVNTLLKAVAKLQPVQSKEKIQEILIDELKNMEIEGVDSKEFTVDGSSHKCSGYKVVVTSENVTNVLSSYLNSFSEGIDEVMSKLGVNLADELKKEFEDMEDATIVCYLYKNKLAALEITYEDETTLYEFQGGDYRSQNMTITSDVETTIVTGSKEGTVETRTITVEGEEKMSYTYDTATHKLELMSNQDGKKVSTTLEVENTGDSIVVKLLDYQADSSSSYGVPSDVDFTLTLSKGADIQQLSGSTVYDFSTMSMMELQTFVTTFESLFRNY